MVLQINPVQRESQRVESLFASFRGQFALPHRDAVPSHPRQLLLRRKVALLIPTDFRHPKRPIRLRNFAANTIHYSFFTIHLWQRHTVSVPETPVHENARPVFPQHQVRMPRQSFVVQPIAESPTPQPTPHNPLRLRVLRPNRCHRRVSLFRREFIHKSIFYCVFRFRFPS